MKIKAGVDPVDLCGTELRLVELCRADMNEAEP